MEKLILTALLLTSILGMTSLERVKKGVIIWAVSLIIFVGTIFYIIINLKP